jgi:hypothetical protein
MSETPKRPLVVIIASILGVAVCISIAAITVYTMVYKPSAKAAVSPLRTAGTPDISSSQQPRGLSPASACGFSANSSMPIAALNRIEAHATELAGHRIFDQALEYFHTVAASDPGFPGVNLEISLALLQLKRADDAKRAVDSQLAISECLAKLSPDDLERYCKAEGLATTERCNQTLLSVWQRAHYQAALVQIQYGHAVDTDPTATGVAGKIASTAPHPRIARTAGERADGRVADPTTVVTAGSRSKEMANGRGTDSDLGAYSKDPTH